MPKKSFADILKEPQRSFSGQGLAMISFPLGGIGTGSVGLSGRGGLVDWEIFNRPNIGSYYPRTFPLIWAREKGKQPVCRVLQSPALPPYQGGGGGDPHLAGEGLPHMDSCTFQGEYPFAWLQFKCRRLPVEVSLEAYNPFIPNDPEASGFPAAILRYSVTNQTTNPVDATVAWSLLNMVGTLGVAERDPNYRDVEFGYGQNVNQQVERAGVRGLQFLSHKYPVDHPRSGSMALVTPNRSVTLLRYWLRAPWFTPMHDFWDRFSPTGLFKDREYPPSEEGQTDAGAVGVRLHLKPGESKTATFYLTWFFPNFEKYWHDCGTKGCCEPKTAKPTWRNHYAKRFKSALDVAVQLHKDEADLYKRSHQFHEALFKSTLPSTVLDAVSSQMSILKTATCIRLTDGAFYAFEGCAPMAGCCEGSCTHVWNYQQALPFLFPSLERSMRSADYHYNLREDGSMCFRLQLPHGAKPNDFHACADGQMGGVMKTYRDWKISGDDQWLKGLWPDVKKSLEFAWAHWDKNRNGVMDEIQHNTYDIEFQGPNPLIACFYLGALEAGARMAEHLGENDSARTYREIAVKGRNYVESKLYNGDYLIQRHDPEKAPQYQFGTGCLSDQLLGQCMASLIGLGELLDNKIIRKTLLSIFRNNWKKELKDHANMQRVYALNDESGLVLCTWPKGGRERVPFPYSDEVWTGFEYQVASHLFYEGFIEEGLCIVKGARDRHDGIRRNPWDEFECGHHYARAMSSYGLLLALSGFRFDRGRGMIGFEPRLNRENFNCFWSLEGCWGTYTQVESSSAELHLVDGSFDIATLELPGLARNRDVMVVSGKRTIHTHIDSTGKIHFSVPVKLRKRGILSINIRNPRR